MLQLLSCNTTPLTVSGSFRHLEHLIHETICTSNQSLLLLPFIITSEFSEMCEEFKQLCCSFCLFSEIFYNDPRTKVGLLLVA